MVSPHDVVEESKRAAEFLEKELGRVPGFAVVLGSGWDVLLEGVSVQSEVAFDSIPGFGRAGVAGHAGRAGVVETGGGRLLVQRGRLHCYEGYSALEVSFYVWTYHRLGVKLVLMFGAAGGLNPTYMPGELMLVADHISLWCRNPLEGVAVEGLPLHPPTVGLYPERWRELMRGCLPEGARCHEGVYVYVPGPSYETPAEASLLRVLGGDAVGMSTVPEAITCGHLGMEVAVLCCISNTLLPAYGPPPSHEAVLERVRGTARSIPGFLEGLASALHRTP